MAKLSAQRRKRLPKTTYALPSQRKYPIPDKTHARNALARAAQSKTSGSYSTVRKNVLKKYPSLKKRTAGRRRKRR